MVNWKYDVFLHMMGNLVDLFFREVVPRGSWRVPQSGPVLFVAAPHANQVSKHPFCISIVVTVNSRDWQASRIPSRLNRQKLMYRCYPAVRRRTSSPTNAQARSWTPSLPAHRPKVGSRVHRLGFSTGWRCTSRPRARCYKGGTGNHLPPRSYQRPNPSPRCWHKLWHRRGPDPGHDLSTAGKEYCLREQ